MTKLDSRIEAQLRDFPLKYEIENRRRHVFIRVEGYPMMCVAGHGSGDENCRWIRGVAAKLRRIKKEHGAR